MSAPDRYLDIELRLRPVRRTHLMLPEARPAQATVPLAQELYAEQIALWRPAIDMLGIGRYYTTPAIKTLLLLLAGRPLKLHAWVLNATARMIALRLGRQLPLPFPDQFPAAVLALESHRERVLQAFGEVRHDSLLQLERIAQLTELAVHELPLPEAFSRLVQPVVRLSLSDNPWPADWNRPAALLTLLGAFLYRIGPPTPDAQHRLFGEWLDFAISSTPVRWGSADLPAAAKQIIRHTLIGPDLAHHVLPIRIAAMIRRVDVENTDERIGRGKHAPLRRRAWAVIERAPMDALLGTMEGWLARVAGGDPKAIQRAVRVALQEALQEGIVEWLLLHGSPHADEAAAMEFDYLHEPSEANGAWIATLLQPLDDRD